MSLESSGDDDMNHFCLANFRMPWLLNRELKVNGNITVMVNAFKLASASVFFWNRLREVGRYGALSIDCDDPSGLEIALKFAHEGQLPITGDNVVALLRAARGYEIPGLLRDCEAFVLSSLTCMNCWSMKHMMSALTYEEDLVSKIDDFILANFMHFATLSGDFPQLPTEQLLLYLRTDRLNIPDEVTLFKTVCCRWVAHDLPRRLPLIPSVLKCLRLGALRLEHHLTQIERHTFVQHNYNKCRDTLSLARRLILRQQRGLRRPIDCGLVGMPRLAYGCLIAFGGGMFCSPFRKLKVYDNRRDHWRMLDRHFSAPARRMFFSACTVGDYIYMLGGLNERFTATATAYRFSLTKRHWSPCHPLLEARFFMSVVVHHDMIYVLGGLGEEWMTSRTVECFHEEEGIWSYVAPMLVHRNRATCNIMNDRIFVCGGVSGDLNQSLDVWNRSCESYDPNTDQWTFITALPEDVWGCYCLVVHSQRLYLIQSHQIHSLDPEEGVWRLEKLSTMVTHLAFSVVVLDDEIYRLCDWSVEKWRPGQKEWLSVATAPWPLGWGHQCLVIEGADRVRSFVTDVK